MNETPKNDPTPSVPPPPAGWSSASGAAPGGQNPWTSQTAQSEQPAQPEQPEQRAEHTTPFGTPAGATPPPPGTPAQQVAQAEPAKKRRVGTLVAGLAIGAILGGGAGAAVYGALDDDNDTTTPATSTNAGSNDGEGSAEPAKALDNVESVADQVQPSVVSISTQTQMGQGGGSGIILTADGEILTNNHVVEGAGENIQVTFSDGTTTDAEVIGTDPDTDLALIKAKDVSGLTPAELGNSGELAVGEQVVAIGSPLGLDGTVTTGIVSALQRPVTAGGDQGQQGGAETYYDAIQTDAPINPGNSGGALVNMAGQVVGINSAILTDGSSSGSIGLGFSIPIDQAKPIVAELRDSGEATHARFGVYIGTPQDGTRGALIDSGQSNAPAVEPNSPADEAGLKEGDIITKVDDRLIADGKELIAASRAYRPGDTVTVTYLRDGNEHTTEVTLGSDAQTT